MGAYMLAGLWSWNCSLCSVLQRFEVATENYLWEYIDKKYDVVLVEKEIDDGKD